MNHRPMTPSRHTPDLVLECPKCKTIARHPGLFRGGMAGARMWTDGRIHAPMIPDIPSITRCGHCDATYWIADATEIGTVRLGDPMAPDEWLKAPPTRLLTATELLEALEAGLGDTTAKQFRLRLMVWHRGNDAVRDDLPGPRPEPLDAAAAQRNCEALLTLLDGAQEGHALIGMEILRTHGRFDESLALYEGSWSESMAPIAAQIAGAARAGRVEIERVVTP